VNSYENFKVKNALIQYLYDVTENIICNILFYSYVSCTKLSCSWGCFSSLWVSSV